MSVGPRRWQTTHYVLDGPAIEFRWGTIFFAPVQTGPGNHPTFYIMGTGSFPVVKRPGLGVDHPPSSPRSKKEKTISLLPLCVFMSSYKVTFTPYDATKACRFVMTYQIDGNLRLHHQ